MICLVTLMMVAAPPSYNKREGEQLSAVMMSAKTRLKPRQATRLAQAVIGAGKAHNIDPLFLLALAYTESRWTRKPRPADRGRSFGLYQLTRSAARSVAYGGVFEDEPSLQAALRSNAKQRALLEDVWVASQTVAAYLARLRDKYGAGADVVYNCGPSRCGRGNRRLKHTRATRAYWRHYRTLQWRLNKVEQTQCFPTGAL